VKWILVSILSVFIGIPVWADKINQQTFAQRGHEVEAKDSGGLHPSASCPSGVCFSGKAGEIPPGVALQIQRYTWRPSCPLALSELVYLELSHWDLADRAETGYLIVHHAVADEVLQIFRQLFDARFPIAHMRPIFEYLGDDIRSMTDNNTSAFNCRPISGSSGDYSLHSYGKALDINPVLNPHVRGNHIKPENGDLYRDREIDIPGMIRKGDLIYRLFIEAGWKWGGNWLTIKDYQHFEKP